jgi:hypothetical protein
MATLIYTASQDSYISEWYPQQNFAASNTLFTGQYLRSGDIYRSLLKFDLSDIPRGCSIEEAELQLFLTRNEAGSEKISITVHYLLNYWNQNYVTWANQPLFNAHPDGAVSINKDTPEGFLSIDISNLVARWYNGSIINNGIILRGEESSNALVGFSSSNSANSQQWPRLRIRYVMGVMEAYEKEILFIPERPAAPYAESTPIRLGARNMATFMVANLSDSDYVRVRPQVSFTGNTEKVFFNAGPWQKLEPQGYPGEGLAITVQDAAEYARVLAWGAGGEALIVYPRTKDD